MVWTSPRTWVAGAPLTAAQLNTDVRDNLKAIGDAWTDYVPAWTGTITNPVIGNGTIVGAYLEVGKLVFYSIVITIGSTTTVGSGTYILSLPVVTAMPGNTCMGAAHFFDSSAANYWAHVAYRTPGVGADEIALSANNARWTNTLPVVPAAGDVISVQGSYEAV